jgi:hypothetical protein
MGFHFRFVNVTALISVIPGRAPSANPESRDSGFALARAPE